MLFRSTNPDDLKAILALRDYCRELDPRLEVRQGETGAPSTAATFGALSGRAWTEFSQAKWDLRRMLAHHAEGLPFNLFTLMELNYNGRWNTKGLLRAKDDGTVPYPKPPYAAAQRAVSLFDSTVSRVSDAKIAASVDGLALHLWRQGAEARPLVTVWDKSAPPGESGATKPVDLTVPAAGWHTPVLVDLMTGAVHSLPRSAWTIDGDTLRLTGVPVGDWPVVIAEREVVTLVP